MCKKELNELGGLLFAPPEKFEYPEYGEEPFYTTMVQKFHICPDCYLDLIKWIKMDYNK
jgi:hypothetical protein